jgi:hypothetical protein
VLFRASHHTAALEIELAVRGIPFALHQEFVVGTRADPGRFQWGDLARGGTRRAIAPPRPAAETGPEIREYCEPWPVER